MSTSQAAFSYKTFVSDLSPFILEHHFTDWPIQEEFHGQEKLSPATLILLFRTIK